MNNIKDERMARMITELAGKYISQESTSQSLITVTRSQVYDLGKKATIFISVLPDKEETPAVNFLKNHLGEIREYIKKYSNLHTLPYLSVDLDYEAKQARDNNL